MLSPTFAIAARGVADASVTHLRYFVRADNPAGVWMELLRMQRRWSLVIGVTLASSGCENGDVSAPTGKALTSVMSSISVTPVGLPLIINERPFRAARSRSDSAEYAINIATVVLSGSPGDSVTLSFDADSRVVDVAAPGLRLVAVVQEETQQFSLAQLLKGVTIHRFASTDTVTIDYTMTRDVIGDARGSVALTQWTSATIVGAVTPWAARPAAPPIVTMSVVTTSETASCTLTQATGICGSLTYKIQPYATGDPFGTFQSDNDTGASSKITITFSAPIISITTTIQDPTYAGNTMSGYDAKGTLVSTVGFSYSGRPGLNVPDTRTIAGSLTKVVLTPAAADYVAYDASAVPTDRSLSVVCTTNIDRGNLLRCTSSLSDPVPFTVVLRRTTGKDFIVEDSTRIVHNAGESDVWEGEAVESGDVHVEVETNENGMITRLQNSATHYDVRARSWATWKFTMVVERVRFLFNPMSEPPIALTAMGVGWPKDTVANDAVLLRPARGPNAGIALIKQPLDINSWEYWLHPALFPPTVPKGSPDYTLNNEWYDDQNGLGSGTCNAEDVATLLKNVRKHEGFGIATQSHVGVANAQLSKLQPQKTVEALYTTFSDDDLRNKIQRALDEFFYPAGTGPYAIAQQEFERVYAPDLLKGITCTFDWNQFDQL